MTSFSDMPRPTADRPTPSIQCPACPSFFGTKQGLSQHCSKIHNNPLAVLQQIRYETHVSPSVPCSLTHVIAVMSINVMRRVQTRMRRVQPLPLLLVQPPPLLQIICNLCFICRHAQYAFGGT